MGTLENTKIPSYKNFLMNAFDCQPKLLFYNPMSQETKGFKNNSRNQKKNHYSYIKGKEGDQLG